MMKSNVQLAVEMGVRLSEVFLEGRMEWLGLGALVLKTMVFSLLYAR
jgi:hypothetical protein